MENFFAAVGEKTRYFKQRKYQNLFAFFPYLLNIWKKMNF